MPIKTLPCETSTCWAPSLLSLLIGIATPASADSADAAESFLDLSLEELSRVVVTSASRKAQALADAPAAIFVITADDIRRSGATNIPQALRLAPGVSVAAIGNNKWAILDLEFQQRFSIGERQDFICGLGYRRIADASPAEGPAECSRYARTGCPASDANNPVPG